MTIDTHRSDSSSAKDENTSFIGELKGYSIQFSKKCSYIGISITFTICFIVLILLAIFVYFVKMGCNGDSSCITNITIIITTISMFLIIIAVLCAIPCYYRCRFQRTYE